MKRVLIETIGIILTILMVCTFIYAVYNYSQLETEINEKIISSGIQSLFIITFLLEFIPNYISPHLTMMSAFLLNLDPLMITFTVIMSSTISSMLGFEMGRKYGKKIVSETFGKKRLNKLENLVNLKGGKSAVLLAAITPVPYIPLIIGSLLMERRNFVLWGVIPRQISYIITALFFIFVIN